MKRVLIVDDSESWLKLYEKAIDETFIEVGIDDYEIDMATSARDGYDFVLQNNDTPYDLIITDLQMEEEFSPKYAGEWFTEQVKTFKNYYKTGIIICSGCYNIKQVAELLEVDYIPKKKAISDINSFKALINKYING